MNVNRLLALAIKDIRETLKNKSALVPMLIVPLIFVVLLPIGFAIGMRYGAEQMQAGFNDPDLQTFLSAMPPAMAAPLADAAPAQQMLIMVFGYMMAPMFLMFPIMYATIIAAESFAGERERKTLEALLYTPATDQELFVGKLLAGFTASIVTTLGMFILYAVVLNIVGWPEFGRLGFPSLSWVILILWVAPALALVSIAFTVFISARSQSFMDAYQTSSMLVLLVVALLAGQLTGVLYLTALTGLLLGVFFWAIAVWMVLKAANSFTRPKLIGIK